MKDNVLLACMGSLKKLWCASRNGVYSPFMVRVYEDELQIEELSGCTSSSGSAS